METCDITYDMTRADTNFWIFMV